MAAAHPGRYTLVAIGPLTNVALATRLDPSFPQNLAGFVFMGGAYAARGNTNFVAEFNIHADPEAAAIVLDAFPYATMISWELSLDGGIPLDTIRALQHSKNPSSTLNFFNDISDFLADVDMNYGMHIMPMPDPIAMALAIDPTLINESAEVEVHIELAGALTRGQTVVNWRGKPRVKVVTTIDVPRFWDMLKKAVGAG
jgi:purine nucleosidase